MSELNPVPPALAYSTPSYTGRPGIITAIAVTCIIVACLSALASVITGLFPVGFYWASKASTSLAASRATAYSVTVPAITAPTSLGPGDAPVAVNTLDSILTLDRRHLRELDSMMRCNGRQILGGDSDKLLTDADVRAAVISSAPQNNGPTATFSTAEGTVVIYADHSIFRSSDGAVTVQNSSQSRPRSNLRKTAAYGAIAATAPSADLTSAEVDQAIGIAHAMNPTPNALQLQTLRVELEKPNQTLVANAATPAVMGTGSRGNGDVTIFFNNGNILSMDPQGKVLLEGPPPLPEFRISGFVAVVNLFEGLASFGVAIYLVVIGIAVLRGSFSSPRLLRIYAWIKVPLAIISGIALAMFGYQFAETITRFPPYGNGPDANLLKIEFSIFGGVAMLFGLLFPIAVLIAMRTRTVREYYLQ